MSEDITSSHRPEKTELEEEKSLFGVLEEKIDQLLKKYQELLEERDRLIAEINGEREKRIRLEKRMEILSQDRENVKARIDQILHRLRSADL